MPEERKTKLVAQRIDPRYVTRRAPMRAFRAVVVLLCAVGALAWWGWHLRAGNERLYNPGPVAPVHAMFENDCGSCHDGKGNQFFKTVSDDACLRCHDAGIHFGQQVNPSSDKHKLIALENGKAVRSAQCIACHTEHKGHDALKGTSDLLCTQCHGDLPKALGKPTALPKAVTAFGSQDHPRFGRQLAGPAGQKWYDPTPLRFNHQAHYKDNGEKLPVGECSTCHKSSNTGGRQIMLPVSYEENCRSCHEMTVPGFGAVPHEQMATVRLFTAGIPVAAAQRIAAMTPDEKKAVLETKVTRTVNKRKVTETKVITEAEWIENQVQELTKKVASSDAGSLPWFKDVDALPPAAKTAATLELYAAYAMPVACNYCHTMEGARAGIAKAGEQLFRTRPTGFHVEPKPRVLASAERHGEAATPTPSTAPAAATAPAATTGPTTTAATAAAIGPRATAEGRRWFAGSVFDHDSHRAVNCAECHAQAKTSSLTTDVLLPDIDGCVKCHESGPTVKVARASSSCVTCHDYHDRSQAPAPKHRRMSIDELLAQGTRK